MRTFLLPQLPSRKQASGRLAVIIIIFFSSWLAIIFAILFTDILFTIVTTARMSKIPQYEKNGITAALLTWAWKVVVTLKVWTNDGEGKEHLDI